jgi:hypothetical protein
MNKLLRLFAASLFSLACASSHATISITTTSTIASPTNLITFDGSSLVSNDSVTNQFAGVTFSGASGAPRFQSCGATWGTQYLTDATYIGTYGPGCTGNTTPDNMSAVFDSAVIEAELKFITHDEDALGMTVTTLLGGVIQEVFTMPVPVGVTQCGSLDIGGNFRCGWLHFTGMTFDTISFAESTASDYISFDNLAYTRSTVPEPGTLALICLIAAGLGFRRQIGAQTR